MIRLLSLVLILSILFGCSEPPPSKFQRFDMAKIKISGETTQILDSSHVDGDWRHRCRVERRVKNGVFSEKEVVFYAEIWFYEQELEPVGK